MADGANPAGETPDGLPVTDEDVLNMLAGLAAGDGTNYLDIYNDSRDDD